jgi:hypothetical protein
LISIVVALSVNDDFAPDRANGLELGQDPADRRAQSVYRRPPLARRQINPP